MQFKTHFCLVSAQAAPNLLPLLDNQIKPEKVVLLVTPAMKNQANFLTEVIKPRGIKVELEEFLISDNFNAMQEQLLDLIAKEDDPTNLALNATGGTKWMAIAAQEVFRMSDAAVFYVDVAQDKVLFLDTNRSPHQLNQSIDLKSYIQAYGYEMREPSKPIGLPAKQKDLCQTLVARVDELESALGQLNFLASDAERKNSLKINLADSLNKQKENPLLSKLLNEFEQANILQQQGKDIIFTSKEAREFTNGGWLEFYVNSLLNTLKGEKVIQDSPHLNLHIQRQGATSHNEIDVCFMAKNRLHLIECKTKRMAGKGATEVTTDTMYKLDSISELGGLGSKAMLVSYRKLRSEDKQRAKDLNIKVVEAEQIKQLGSSLRSWI